MFIYTAAKGLPVKADITKIKNTNNALQDETKKITRGKLIKLQLNWPRLYSVKAVYTGSYETINKYDLLQANEINRRTHRVARANLINKVAVR